jgi:hypothetical protein
MKGMEGGSKETTNVSGRVYQVMTGAAKREEMGFVSPIP